MWVQSCFRQTFCILPVNQETPINFHTDGYVQLQEKTPKKRLYRAQNDQEVSLKLTLAHCSTLYRFDYFFFFKYRPVLPV